jgi:hypothetical protein
MFTAFNLWNILILIILIGAFTYDHLRLWRYRRAWREVARDQSGDREDGSQR